MANGGSTLLPVLPKFCNNTSGTCANGIAAGVEFQVTTTHNYADPSVTALSNGQFVVTWDDQPISRFDVFARIYNANGTPAAAQFQVNATTPGNECGKGSTPSARRRASLARRSSAVRSSATAGMLRAEAGAT